MSGRFSVDPANPRYVLDAKNPDATAGFLEPAYEIVDDLNAGKMRATWFQWVSRSARAEGRVEVVPGR